MIILIPLTPIVWAGTYTQPPLIHELWSKDLDALVYSATWSPDGKKLAVGLSVGRISVLTVIW